MNDELGILQELYVCDTYFHLYSTLLETYEKDRSNIDLLISDNIDDANKLIEKLIEIFDFNKVLFLPTRQISSMFLDNNKKWLYLFYRKRLVKYIEHEIPWIIDYLRRKVNIFVDGSVIGQYFIIKKSNITLIEDGNIIYFKFNKNLKTIIKKNLFGIPYMYGREKAVIKIKVQSPSKLPKDIYKKSEMIDLKKIESNLVKIQKEKIFKCFFDDDYRKISCENSLILITSPYSEDKFITEEEKIALYKDILKKYTSSENIYLKRHPREKTDYKDKLGVNFIEISKNFPLEVFNLIEQIRFNTGITIYSSALEKLSNVDKKIVLGLDVYPKLEENYFKIKKMKK